MFNNIAVILRGTPRTWDYTKPAIFKFYESISHHVDYYFSTWDAPYINIPKIKQDFQGRSLVVIVSSPWHIAYSNPFNAMDYFRKRVKPYKIAREKEVTYDVIIESRPDVIPLLSVSELTFKPNHKELYVPTFGPIPPGSRLGISDIFYMCNSETYNLMTKLPYYDIRRGLPGEFVEHIQYDHCRAAGIQIKVITGISFCLSRPTHIYMFPNVFDINVSNIDKFVDVGHQWRQLTVLEKEQCLLRHNMHKDAYMDTPAGCQQFTV